MTRTWQRIFVDHPHSVDVTYFEHMCFAGRFAARLLLAGCVALIHAIVPCLFEKTASRMIGEMHGAPYETRLMCRLAAYPGPTRPLAEVLIETQAIP